MLLDPFEKHPNLSMASIQIGYRQSGQREVVGREDQPRGLDAIMAESGCDGWHTTNTTDLDVVLECEVVLQVEDGEVVHHSGACIVQHGTRHR
jgi:hypothetical protein